VWRRGKGAGTHKGGNRGGMKGGGGGEWGTHGRFGIEDDSSVLPMAPLAIVANVQTSDRRGNTEYAASSLAAVHRVRPSRLASRGCQFLRPARVQDGL